MILIGKRFLSFLKSLLFWDVFLFMRRLGQRALTFDDLQDYCRRVGFHWKLSNPVLEDWLPGIRCFPFRAFLSMEKKNILIMVILSISETFFSILKTLLFSESLKPFSSDSYGESLYSKYVSSYLGVFPFASICLLCIFVFGCLDAFCYSFKSYREGLLQHNIQETFLQILFQYVLEMSQKGRIRYKNGEIINIGQQYGKNLGDFFSVSIVETPVVVVSIFCIMLVMLGRLGSDTWVVFVLLILQIPLTLLFSWYGVSSYNQILRLSEKRLGLIAEWIQGSRLVRYLGWNDFFKKQIEQLNVMEVKKHMKVILQFATAHSLAARWWMLLSAGLFAAFLFSKGEVSSIKIFEGLWFTLLLGKLLSHLPWSVFLVAQGVASLRRIRQFVSNPLIYEEYPTGSVVDLPDVLNEIIKKNPAYSFKIGFTLENVTVCLGTKVPVLEKISLVIHPHTSVAIVGHVGSGKSVFLQTLMGEYTPACGRVLCDVFVTEQTSAREDKVSVDVHSRAGAFFLRHVQSLISQEAFIQNATISENVHFMYRGATMKTFPTEKEIMRALTKASFGRDMRCFGDNTEAELGEKGVNLSGGQKQRLSIARSFMADRSVVFMDDPMSALDEDTESELAQSFFLPKSSQRKTILWATHRMNFLFYVDYVIFFRSGKVLEYGLYKDLVSDPSSLLFQTLAKGMKCEK